MNQNNYFVGHLKLFRWILQHLFNHNLSIEIFSILISELLWILANCFQKMVLLIMLWLIVSKMVWFEVEEFCEIFADSAPFFNISRTVAQTHINHMTFWKSVTRFFKCIHVNCLSRLGVLAEVSTKLQKIDFFSII